MSAFLLSVLARSAQLPIDRVPMGNRTASSPGSDLPARRSPGVAADRRGAPPPRPLRSLAGPGRRDGRGLGVRRLRGHVAVTGRVVVAGHGCRLPESRPAALPAPVSTSGSTARLRAGFAPPLLQVCERRGGLAPSAWERGPVEGWFRVPWLQVWKRGRVEGWFRVPRRQVWRPGPVAGGLAARGTQTLVDLPLC
jgi:hypothetical protein